jgi:alkyl sulfatase BDS1-like metallo-beta-lactamase superfamily hydrolase
MHRSNLITALAAVLALAACHKTAGYEEGADADGHTAPTAATTQANAKVAEEVPLADPQDFDDAKRGLVASDPDLKIAGPGGATVWDMPSYGFIKDAAPASVNPSLWRQAQLNDIHGLFKVTDGLYQLRGYDISNMTLIEGKTGWIVVDPLTAKETAQRAWDFARKHLGDKPVTAVIFSHSHADHFGGVLGIVSAEDAKARHVRIIAPQGFMEESTSENVLAGTAMARRSLYMYGRRLAHSPRGHVDSGIGKTPAYGSIGILAPTELITHTGEELVIDGVKFVFQNAPASEAPAEMNFYLPERKAFCAAEITSHTLHNLYTLRGAKVRDGLKWSGYIDEILQRFPDTEIYFGSHTWPVWGRERVSAYFEAQRDTYKFIHDQTLRLALEGETPLEIAEELRLPASLQKNFPTRSYYGTVSHDAKAVYQFYFGWYDGNPANLNPLPPVEAGRKYVEAMGGADKVLELAQGAFDKAEYRWVAEVLNHLVFAQPDNAKAKALLAKTYDQLGYQAESAPWRDEYLTGAYELRHGAPEKGVDLSLTLDLLRETPMPRFLDAMAVRLKGPDAEGKDLTVNLVLTDRKESYVLNIKNSVLHYHAAPPDPKAAATLNITKELYLKMLSGKAGLKDTLMSDDLKVTGSRLDLLRFFGLFEKPGGAFNIVTP